MRAQKGFIQFWIYCIIDCLTQPFSYPPAALWKKHGSGSQWRDDKRLEAQSNWVSTTKDSKHFKEKFCQFSFKSGLKQQKLQHWRQFKQIRPMVQQTTIFQKKWFKEVWIRFIGCHMEMIILMASESLTKTKTSDGLTASPSKCHAEAPYQWYRRRFNQFWYPRRNAKKHLNEFFLFLFNNNQEFK